MGNNLMKMIVWAVFFCDSGHSARIISDFP